ncbi:MAG: AraC family transcriptional regulator [Shewanella sp.]
MKTVYHPLKIAPVANAEIFFNFQDFLPHTVTPSHQHEWGQVQFISAGTMELYAKGQRLVSPSQFAIWVPAGVEHQSYTRRGIHYCAMNIIAAKTDVLPLEPCLLAISEITQAIINDLRLRQITLASSDADKRLVAVLVDELIKSPVMPEFLPSSQDKLLQPMLAALDSEPANSNSIKQWAALLHTSERTLARRCQEILGMSFTELRQRHKFIYSLQLLREGLSIKDVALMLGYNQTSPFIVMFKKYAQSSPEQYRRQLGHD